MPLEIQNILVVSTRHIPEHDAKLLEKESTTLSTIHNTEYGFLIWLPWSSDKLTIKARCTELEKQGLSETLSRLVMLAYENGCSYLNLDCDGPVLSFLETFDW